MVNESKVAQLRALACAAICLYMLLLIVDGVARWFLDSRGIPAALYARDLLALGGLIAAWQIATAEHWLTWKRMMVGLACFYLLWLLVGTFSGVPLVQGLFACKTLMAIPTGMALWLLLRGADKKFCYFAIAAAGLVLVGVLADIRFDLPWAGLTYQIGDISLEGQREWVIDDTERLAGFSRASFEAGSQLAVLGAIILNSRLRAALKVFLIPAIIFGIILTTSRSSLLAAGIYGACYIGLRLRPNACLNPVWLVIVWLPAIVVVGSLAFPEVTKALEAKDRGGLGSTMSFAMRTEGNWIDSLNRLETAEEWIIGRGMGALGAAQVPFERDLFVAPDNLFVYTLVNFGLIGSLVVFSLFSAAWRRGGRSGISQGRYSLLIALTCAYGMTQSAVEGAFIGLALGLGLAEAVCGEFSRLPSA